MIVRTACSFALARPSPADHAFAQPFPLERCEGKSFATDMSYSSPTGSVRPVTSRISFALSDSDFSKA
jgi:hypothetical protein